MPPRQVITCHDLAGRRGQLIVFNDHGRVVLVTAAGETAVLTSQQVGQLRGALRAAVLSTVLPIRHAATDRLGPASMPTGAGPVRRWWIGRKARQQQPR